MRTPGLLLLLPLLAAGQQVETVALSDRQLLHIAADSRGDVLALGSFLDAYVLYRWGSAGNPVGETPFTAAISSRAAVLRVDREDRVYVGLVSPSGTTQILRVNTGSGWAVEIERFELRDLSFDTAGNPVLLGKDSAGIRVVKLDGNGNRIADTHLGSPTDQPQAVAVGPSGDVYVTGFASPSLPLTAGSYRAAFPADCGPGCIQGFLMKIDSKLERLVYSTLVGSTFPTSVAIAADGSAYVAGVLLSGFQSGFETTEGAFQRSTPERLSYAGNRVVPFPSMGFVTRLDGDGSRVVASTLLAGNYSDSIAGVGLDANGNPIVYGGTGSPVFPTTGISRIRCRAEGSRPRFGEGFAVRFDSMLTRVEYSAVLPQQSMGPAVVAGGRVYAVSAPSLANDGTGGPRSRIVRIDFTESSTPVACIVNGGSMLVESAIVPGQLLTVYGSGLDGAEVRVGGRTAELLAASSGQINLVVPRTLAGARTTVEVARDGRTLYRLPMGVVTMNPSPLLRYGTAGVDFDTDDLPTTPLADAINEDGSVNDADHPAAAGTVLTVYATGLSDAERVYVATAYGDIEAAAVENRPGVWAVRFRVPALPGLRRLQFRLAPPLPSAMPVTNFVYVAPRN